MFMSVSTVCSEVKLSENVLTLEFMLSISACFHRSIFVCGRFFSWCKDLCLDKHNVMVAHALYLFTLVIRDGLLVTNKSKVLFPRIGNFTTCSKLVSRIVSKNSWLITCLLVDRKQTILLKLFKGAPNILSMENSE